MCAARTRRSFAARTVWLAAATAIAIALPAPSWGEDDEFEDEEGLETLFVTAEKKVSDLQQTGGSVVAFNEAMLEDRSIYDVKSITEYVPNVKIHTNVGGNTGFAVNIRGALKADPIISREPVVGLYVDDVYLANMAGILFDVLDLEAIEILLGPQGTLYGRNTNGGAIKLRTKAPTDRLSLRNDLTYGNFDAVNNRTVLNLPLLGDSEDALFGLESIGALNTRTAFAYLSRKGYVDAFRNDQIVAGSPVHPVGADELDDIGRWAVHHRSQWQPTEALTIDYIFDKTHAREEPSALQLSFVEPDDGDPFNVPPPGDNPLINGVGVFGIGVDITPFVRTSRVGQIAQGLGANGSPLYSRLDVWGHAVTVALAVPTLPVLGDVNVKSITAHRKKKNADASDIDGTGFDLFASELRLEHEQFSQELQFNGDAAGGAVDYVAGLYYFQEKGKSSNQQEFMKDATFDLLGAFDPGFVSDLFHKVEKEAWAGYGQLSYTPPILEHRLTLSGGLRYTNETVELDVLNTNIGDVAGATVLVDTGIGGAPNVARPKATFDDVSWLARAMFQFTDDVMGYFKVSTGFLSGGFNARNANLVPARPFGIAYEPEMLKSYEVGLRSDLFERRVRLNGTLFYYDYEDIQVSQFDPSTGGGASTLVVNAASASLWGAELELLLQPFEGAEVNLGYGYIHAEYDEFIDVVTSTDVANMSEFAQTPSHQLIVGGEYTLPAFRWGTVLGRMDWSYTSAVGFSDRRNPVIDEAASWLLHGMVQVADVELPANLGTGRFQFWVKNITDEKFKEFGFSLGPFGFALNTYVDPRTYGATFVWEWEK
jgi:iron complex outermembrane receptor protein